LRSNNMSVAKANTQRGKGQSTMIDELNKQTEDEQEDMADILGDGLYYLDNKNLTELFDYRAKYTSALEEALHNLKGTDIRIAAIIAEHQQKEVK